MPLLDALDESTDSFAVSLTDIIDAHTDSVYTCVDEEIHHRKDAFEARQTILRQEGFRRDGRTGIDPGESSHEEEQNFAGNE